MQQQLNLRSLAFKFVGIEGVVTAIVDRFPQYLRRGYRKEMFTALVCVVWFLIGLSMVTEVNRIKFLLLSFLISSSIGIFPKTTAMVARKSRQKPSKHF